MTEQDLPRELAQRLDEGLNSLSPGVTLRLRAARETALARAREGEALLGPASAAALAGGSHELAWAVGRRMLAPAIAVALALLGMLYWQQAQRVHLNAAESSDLDAELLVEELPVNAYLDQGFEVWLYHSTPASDQARP